MQKQYLREIKKIYDGYSFYDAFLDFPEVSIYRKKLIIDSILAKLSDEQRDNVIRALKKEILIKDVPSLRAILRRVKSQYESLIKRNLYGRNIYNILPDINGIGNEKKMEIADKLFSRFSLERQENMLRLLALEINSSSESGHMAYQDLDIYKRQYNRYIEDRIVGWNNFCEMVNSNFGLNLDAAMSFDKMDLLWSSLEIVEDSFRRNGKDKRPVYIKYMYRVLEKIILSDPDLDLQNLIIRYITVTINCVVNRR